MSSNIMMDMRAVESFVISSKKGSCVTAVMNCRLFWVIPPQLPLRPGRWGSSKSHTLSIISWRLCEFIILSCFL